jgi:hypothetical protein
MNDYHKNKNLTYALKERNRENKVGRFTSDDISKIIRQAFYQRIPDFLNLITLSVLFHSFFFNKIIYLLLFHFNLMFLQIFLLWPPSCYKMSIKIFNLNNTIIFVHHYYYYFTILYITLFY